MCKKITTMSTMAGDEKQQQQHEAQTNVNEKLNGLKEKIVRTTKFLKELKTLSKNCQEMTTAEVKEDDTDDDAYKERQVNVEISRLRRHHLTK